uniref:Hypothetical secreted peptide n=1 Tax=Glossina morsitans morsitans TaxID=37546 RepID=D3TSM7_GLOMM
MIHLCARAAYAALLCLPLHLCDPAPFQMIQLTLCLYHHCHRQEHRFQRTQPL